MTAAVRARRARMLPVIKEDEPWEAETTTHACSARRTRAPSKQGSRTSAVLLAVLLRLFDLFGLGGDLALPNEMRVGDAEHCPAILYTPVECCF
jgi:hypothetical protein